MNSNEHELKEVTRGSDNTGLFSDAAVMIQFGNRLLPNL